MSEDTWSVGPLTLESRVLLGTAAYPSREVMLSALEASTTQLVTVSMRRVSASSHRGNLYDDLHLECHQRCHRKCLQDPRILHRNQNHLGRIHHTDHLLRHDQTDHTFVSSLH